eukprot:748028-Hanusia_phi.AAC.1
MDRPGAQEIRKGSRRTCVPCCRCPDTSQSLPPSRVPSAHETPSDDNIETAVSRCPSSQCQKSEDLQVHDCIICLEGMDNADHISTLPCNHSFHESCIKRFPARGRGGSDESFFRWMDTRGELRLSHRCPHCNQDVFPAEKLEGNDGVEFFSTMDTVDQHLSNSCPCSCICCSCLSTVHRFRPYVELPPHLPTASF